MAKSKSGESIRYSLPTIAGDAPPLDQSKLAPAGALSWHEDEWRQIEFVSVKDAPYLESVLHEHADFRNRYRERYGFRALYVRHDFPTPIRSLRIPIREIEVWVEPQTTQAALYMGPTSAAFEVSGGRSFFIPGLGTLYLTEKEGLVDALGIFPDDSAARPSTETMSGLANFGKRHQLALIDWQMLFAFDIADTEAANDWLSARKQAGAP